MQLRAVTRQDGELLRTWKNTHRHLFFHKDVISAEAQARWMEGHLARPDDHMFVVWFEDRPVGCMAVRLLDGEGDIYNVILGDAAAGGRGVMGVALRMMLAYARSAVGVDIGLKVLSDNPAVRFYERNGLAITANRGDHLVMKVDWARVETVELA